MSKPRPQPGQPDDPNRPNTKRTGEHSEVAFLYRADQRRFAISKPFGDSERYDSILDNRPIPGACPSCRSPERSRGGSRRACPERSRRACPERSRRACPERSRRVQLFRIQVKCTECLRADAYETRATYSVGKGRAVYTKRDIDFIAAHVVPLDIWYIIPVEVCTPQPMLRFYPHRQARKMRLEKYREAWHLLDPPLPSPPITIQACIDENYPDGYQPEDEAQRMDGAGEPPQDLP